LDVSQAGVANVRERLVSDVVKKISKIVHLSDAPVPLKEYAATVAWGRNFT
jgi:hypothetical protein